MSKIITGYAVRFNEETVISGLWREKVAPSAFEKSLRDYPDVLALYGHDYNRVLGRTAAGTLELRPDRIGLDFTLYVDESTPDGLTALGNVRRQDISGCSFSFAPTRETWLGGDDYELPLRIIEEAMLFEISIVSLPAYPTTSATLFERSAAAVDNSTNARRRVAEREAAMRRRGIAV